MGSVFSLQRLRLSGVGSRGCQCQLSTERTIVQPAGKPCRIIFHTWLESSSSVTSRILFWTVSSFTLLSCHSIASSLSSLLQWLLNDLLKMAEIED